MQRIEGRHIIAPLISLHGLMLEERVPNSRFLSLRGWREHSGLLTPFFGGRIYGNDDDDDGAQRSYDHAAVVLLVHVASFAPRRLNLT